MSTRLARPRIATSSALLVAATCMVAGLTAPAYGATSAPTAVKAPTARVGYAKLQVDGSASTRVAFTCPKGSRFSLVAIVTQQYESNGSIGDAVGYSPAKTGACTGWVQRVWAHVSVSQRVPFSPDIGPDVSPYRIGPTLGLVDLTLVSPVGARTLQQFSNEVILR